MELAIETKNLKKHFGDIHAVDGIDLKVPKGTLFGFLGPNGAGKTTTISMLSTILPPTSGEATILGNDIQKDSNRIKEIIGVCPQEVVLYERLTARENINLIAKMHRLKKEDYKEKTDDIKLPDKHKRWLIRKKMRIPVVWEYYGKEPCVMVICNPLKGNSECSTLFNIPELEELIEKLKLLKVSERDLK